MSILQAIILGVIQGLTEFLPVSSSGHLELAKAILGDTSLPEESMMMTVVLHGATALSTIVIYRKEILKLLDFSKMSLQYIFKIVVSMVPAAFVGVVFNDEIEALFSGQVMLVGAMLLITGLLLFLADRAKRTDKEVSLGSAAIIGISQAIAILPGISRSGATISTSVLLGIDKEQSAKFSFLMVVPLILGKMAKDILDGGLAFNADKTMSLAVGFIAAFVTGLFACNWMIALVKKAQLKHFAYYCFVVGTASLVYTLI